MALLSVFSCVLWLPNESLSDGCRTFVPLLIRLFSCPLFLDRSSIPIFDSSSGILVLIHVPARRAEHAELAVFDQAHGYAFQHFAHRALVAETRREIAVDQKFADLRKDAAREMHAALCAVQQHEIADDAAQPAAENLQCLARDRIAAVHARFRDFTRRQRA